MNEMLRLACRKAGKILQSDALLDKYASDYYNYGRENILCECPKCKCPAAGGRRYSFVYIDESRRLMYFDVPKAASTTIRNAFFQNRSSASMRNPKRGLDEYTKFTFVRNPWDRMVSNWKMFTSQPARIGQLRSMTNKDLKKFDDFVYFAITMSNHHWQPQSMFTPEKLDFIGKLETFDDDMNNLRELVGEAPLNLKKHNTTHRKRYQEYYSTSLVDVVADYYNEDIAKFGFRF